MRISGITPDEFDRAVEKAGVLYGDNIRAEHGTVHGARRFNARVVLRETGYQRGLPTTELAPGQRRAKSAPRRINAVCWHVYRDVLREVFNIAPDARITTELAKYRGRDGFETEYPKTAAVNIGSAMYPVTVTMPELCDCPVGLRWEEVLA